MIRTFEGFESSALATLAKLPEWSRDDYAAGKAELKRGLLDPAVGLISQVAEELSERVGSELTVKPKIGGSVSPMNRDLRFAKDKTVLYKDAVMLTTWDGNDKKSSPMFWIRIAHDSVGFASGIGFDKTVRERWRNAVADETTGQALVDALAPLEKHPTYDLDGASLKNAPKPWGNEHPRADLLRHTAIQARWSEPTPPTATLPRFTGFCVDKLSELIPVHLWLKEHLS